MASTQSIPFYTAQTLIVAQDYVSDTYRVRELHHKFVGVVKTENTDNNTKVNAKIQHSFNGTDWFDLIDFGTINGSDTSRIVYLSESNIHVLPYLRGYITMSGSTVLSDVTLHLFYETSRV